MPAATLKSISAGRPPPSSSARCSQGSVKFATPRIAARRCDEGHASSRLDEVCAEACGETGLTARELEVRK